MKYSKEEKEFLDEINQYLPKNIDWKIGAKNYLSSLLKDNPSTERYHLVKPFIGGPDFSSFFEEMNNFINMVQKLNLPMKSNIIDVGTGPGWISHFLGKLGHNVLGIDISQELLEIAEKRIKNDPFPPYLDIPFTVEFKIHDIEKDPIKSNYLFDVAIFASTLHHFFDPISALKNVGHCLKKSGVIVILEGSAPERDSIWCKKNYDLMIKYNTLERPYTREQITKLLDLTGFKYYNFYSAINRFFVEQNKTGEDELKNIINRRNNYNYVIASKENVLGINKQSDLLEVEETSLFKILKNINQIIPHKIKYKKKKSFSLNKGVNTVSFDSNMGMLR